MYETFHYQCEMISNSIYEYRKFSNNLVRMPADRLIGWMHISNKNSNNKSSGLVTA